MYIVSISATPVFLHLRIRTEPYKWTYASRLIVVAKI